MVVGSPTSPHKKNQCSGTAKFFKKKKTKMHWPTSTASTSPNFRVSVAKASGAGAPTRRRAEITPRTHPLRRGHNNTLPLFVTAQPRAVRPSHHRRQPKPSRRLWVWLWLWLRERWWASREDWNARAARSGDVGKGAREEHEGGECANRRNDDHADITNCFLST